MNSPPIPTNTPAKPLLDTWREAVRSADDEPEYVMSDATTLYVAGRSGLAGRYQGEDAILHFVALLEEVSGATLLFSPARVVRAADHAVLLGRLRAGSGQAAVISEAVLVLEFHPGLVDAIWLFCQDGGALDRIGPGRSWTRT